MTCSGNLAAVKFTLCYIIRRCPLSYTKVLSAADEANITWSLVMIKELVSLGMCDFGDLGHHKSIVM